MSNEEKRICIVEYLGKRADWESWSEQFLLHEKRKGCKKLLVSNRSMSGVDKISQDLYKDAMEGNTDLKKKIMELGESKEIAYEDLILSSTLVPLYEKWHLDW